MEGGGLHFPGCAAKGHAVPLKSRLSPAPGGGRYVGPRVSASHSSPLHSPIRGLISARGRAEAGSPGRALLAPWAPPGCRGSGSAGPATLLLGSCHGSRRLGDAGKREEIGAPTGRWGAGCLRCLKLLFPPQCARRGSGHCAQISVTASPLWIRGFAFT